MLAATIEKTDEVLELMWGNWEAGLQKAYDSQQAYGKLSLETYKKQQELLQSITSNLCKVEADVKQSISNLAKSFKENSKYIQNKEAARVYEDWNEKVTDILTRLQELSITPSKATLELIEQSQEKMYESFNKIAEEQGKIQTESKGITDSFVAHLKESQASLVKLWEEQTKQVLKVSQPI